MFLTATDRGRESRRSATPDAHGKSVKGLPDNRYSDRLTRRSVVQSSSRLLRLRSRSGFWSAGRQPGSRCGACQPWPGHARQRSSRTGPLRCPPRRRGHRRRCGGDARPSRRQPARRTPASSSAGLTCSGNLSKVVGSGRRGHGRGHSDAWVGVSRGRVELSQLRPYAGPYLRQLLRAHIARVEGVEHEVHP